MPVAGAELSFALRGGALLGVELTVVEPLPSGARTPPRPPRPPAPPTTGEPFGPRPLPSVAGPPDRPWTLAQFIREARAELRKTAWPARGQALRVSGLVLSVVVAFGACFGLLDAIAHVAIRNWIVGTR